MIIGRPLREIMRFYHVQESPLGLLLLTSDGAAITGLFLQGAEALQELEGGLHGVGWRRGSGLLVQAAGQLAEYFAGSRTRFEVPLLPEGTTFRREVWAAMAEIPYGATASYGEIAVRIGRPAAVRAVGGACAKNPLPILLPCHRVVGSDGSLKGFGGGLNRKRVLLDLEVRGRGPHLA